MKTKKNNHSGKKAFKEAVSINIMYVPALCLISFFIVYPFMKGIYVSFTDWNGYSQHFKMVGMQNYVRLFHDKDMVNTIINTLIYGFGSAIFQNVLGLSFALLLDKKLPGSSLVRVIIYLPTMISGLVMGYIWYFFLSYNNGALQDIFSLLNLPVGDLLAKGKITVLLITLVNIYAGSGTAMIFYQAGLQSISADYYEVARLDGASSWKLFTNITLPLLIPSMEFNITLNLIGSFKLFDMIKSLTNGGPAYSTESMATMMYRFYFSKEQAGYASALGNVMTILIIVIAGSALMFLRKREVEL